MSPKALEPVSELRERLARLVTDSVASPHSKRAYAYALGEFFAWWPIQSLASASLPTHTMRSLLIAIASAHGWAGFTV